MNSPFAEIITELSERLDLPQPARSRLLLEVAADLEDLFAFYREQGKDEATARQQALEQCDLSDESLTQLVQVHCNGLRHWLDGISIQVRGLYERIILIALVAFVALASGGMMLSQDFFHSASEFIWPVLATALVTLALVLRKVYGLWLKQDHHPRRLRRGLSPILYLAGVQLLLGAYGFWLELYGLAWRARQDLEPALAQTLDWLTEGSALLVFCFAVSMLTALAWLALAQKVAQVEEAELEFLLNS